MHRVIITDHGFTDVDRERSVLADAQAELEVFQCKTSDDVSAAARNADAIIVQWAPVDRAAIESLTRCKIIVRYGIGVDNVDLDAAREAGIPVCNVPDYCIDEVADHTMALALALARQITETGRRIEKGVWKIVPDRPMPAFRKMTFATVGLGRIARAVHVRAGGFGFRLAAADPVAPDSAFEGRNVQRLDLDELCRRADILSLHAPVTPATSHLIDRDFLKNMKDGAILINTARGALVDSEALADALDAGKLAGAGLDVFETEPLALGHRLRGRPNVVLTSHMAWYSESSVPRLQKLAAEEVVRALRGEPLKNCVNP